MLVTSGTGCVVITDTCCSCPRACLQVIWWTFRLVGCMKPSPQCWQRYGFSPVWMRSCACQQTKIKINKKGMILVRVRRDFHLGLETAEKCGKKSRLGFSCKLLLTVLCFHKVAKNKPDIRSVKNLTWILLEHYPS